jgi:hypothetical protein
MARYGKESKLSPDKVMEKALEFFGPGGLGLEVKEQGEDCATFEGGGGHVFVQACEKGLALSGVEGPVLSGVEGPVLSGVEGPVLSGVEGIGSEVDLETREWDYQVKQFMGKI